MSEDIPGQEKRGNHKKHGMSFDMMSPYILPAGLNHSRDSLHSLSRNINAHEDPYRPVTALGDNGSIRSGRKHDGSSIHTGYSGGSGPKAGLVGNASQMGTSTVNTGFPRPPRTGSMPQNSGALSPTGNSPTNISPIEPAYFPTAPSLDDRDNRNNNSLMPGGGQDPRESYMGQDTAALRLSNNYLGSYIAGGEGPKSPPPSAPKREVESPFTDRAAIQMPEEPRPVATKSTTPPPVFQMPDEPLPPRQASLPPAQPPAPQIPTIAEPEEWKDDKYDDNDAFYVTPPSPPTEKVDRRASRYSMDVPPEEYIKAGLGAPGVDARRVSMGFRPLPNMLAVESDDPEVRANRIRSFYKEYFDDSKPAPQGQYYEDYDDGAYHDYHQGPAQPYAEPMPRRAMTPPPNVQRFMGQHPPRALHGSLANNNYGPPQPRGYNGPPFPRGTPTGTPRQSNGSEWRGPPGFAEPRPYSSASNRSRGTQQSRSRTPLPPPEDLNTIPTPALLKDDSFAILNATDFAPPTTYAERTRGRSQSPMGERRAYNPRVPAAKQLNSAFDELAVIPSP